MALKFYFKVSQIKQSRTSLSNLGWLVKYLEGWNPQTISAEIKVVTVALFLR